MVYDDVPINLMRKPVGADRVFNSVLAGASAIVLVLLVAVVVFLCKYGFAALRRGGIRIWSLTRPGPRTPTTSACSRCWWVRSPSPSSPSLIALPISLASALMINEYAPTPAQAWLTGVVDMLATVPSIVYGFWGLQLVSGLQAAPAKWLVDHVSFVPFFRTPSPGST